MRLQLLEDFTLEIPRDNQENEVLKGKLRPLSATEKESIKNKYQGLAKDTQDLEMATNDVAIISERLDNIKKQIELQPSMELLQKQESLLDELTKLKSNILTLSEKIKGFDKVELVSKENLRIRLIADDTVKQRIFSVCEAHGYSMVYDTILKDIKEGKQQESRN